MLANGITLGYKELSGGSSYTILTGLKEVPELGDEPEKVENTSINVQNYFQLISSYKIPMQKEKTLTQILV